MKGCWCCSMTCFRSFGRKGRQALEEHIETPQNSDLFKRSGFLLITHDCVTYICDNMRMTNLGQISAKELESLLESELITFETEQNAVDVHALKRAADDSAPGFGIVASGAGCHYCDEFHGWPDYCTGYGGRRFNGWHYAWECSPAMAFCLP